MRKQIVHTTVLSNVKNIQDVTLDLVDALYHCDSVRLCVKMKEGVLEFNSSKGSRGASESDKVTVRFTKPIRVDERDVGSLLASLSQFRDLDDTWFIEKLTAFPNMFKMSIGNAGVIIDSQNSH